MEFQETFVYLKPESVLRGLIGEIVSRFEKKGLLLGAAKLIQMTVNQAETLYGIHNGKPFYSELISHVTSAPVFVMVWIGPDAVRVARSLIGATNPLDAQPGTIRGDFGLTMTPNAIHASDSVENAKRELAIFFSPEQILHYTKPTERDFIFK